jgi:hypothetical protein
MSAAVSGLAITTAAPAVAEANGVGATPAMGWSSWSFIRHDPTAADIEAQAAAMASSGLSSAGYDYANVDDQREQLQLRRHDRHQLQCARRAGFHQLLG